MLTVRLASLVLLSMTITSCSSWFGGDEWFHDRSNDYLQARATAPIKVPKEYDSYPLGDKMIIPDSAGAAADIPASFVVPKPDQLVVQSTVADFRIERVEGKRLLLAQRPPDSIWQQMPNFWQQNKLSVLSSDKNSGVMQTDWFHAKGASDVVGQTINNITGLGDTPEIGSYRALISPGVLPQSSTIDLQYTSAPLPKENESAPKANWQQPTSGEKRIANGMLNELLVYLTEQNKIHATNSAVQADGTSILKKDGNGNLILQLNLPYTEAWVATGDALEKADIKIADEDQNIGLYYINVDDEGKSIKEAKTQSGWFSWFSSNDKQAAKTKEKAYRLRLSQINEAQVHLFVEKDADTVAPESLSRYLLTNIQSNLPHEKSTSPDS